MSVKLNEDQRIEANNIICKEFFTAMVGIASCDESVKELTYIKNSITIPSGGIYLVSILHINGPKLDLEQLKLVSDAIGETSKKKRKSKKIDPAPTEGSKDVS
jgi:hypothetical protein